MGFGVLTHFNEVLKGYKEGLLVKGIIDLNIPKEQILNYKIEEFKEKIKKEKPTKFSRILFSFWVIVSVFIVISPIFLLIPLLLFL